MWWAFCGAWKNDRGIGPDRQCVTVAARLVKVHEQLTTMTSHSFYSFFECTAKSPPPILPCLQLSECRWEWELMHVTVVERSRSQERDLVVRIGLGLDVWGRA